jgi:nicotinate-nucleotide adenylyltransferase
MWFEVRDRFVAESMRIGVYGGTFDPIHNTHLAIAHAALVQVRLDRVLFVVSANPPHKRNDVSADAAGRYAMVEAAVADTPAFVPSALEIGRDGPSYTADTLRTLAQEFPGAALFLILGWDSLADLPRWREPQEIIARARLIAVPRPQPIAPAPPELAGRYDVLRFDESALSSTEVRMRLQAGENVKDVVPPAVLRIIEERGLYADARR